MLGLVKNILDVAKTVHGIATGAAAVTRDRRDRLAGLLKDISETLNDAAQTLKQGQTPHGACGALYQYSDALDPALEGFVTKERAAELGDKLRSSYQIERLAIELESSKDRSTNIAALEEASGTFHAASQLLRAT